MEYFSFQLGVKKYFSSDSVANIGHVCGINAAGAQEEEIKS